MQFSADRPAGRRRLLPHGARTSWRFREAVDDDDDRPEVAAHCRRLAAAGYDITAIDELKTAPRGYAEDHPRIELLRRKGLVAMRSWPVAKWLHTSKSAKVARPPGATPAS